MSAIRSVAPVKLICGIIAVSAEAIDRATERLVRLYGSIDIAGEAMPFDFTDYYEAEMGPGLLRKFVSFERMLDDPSAIVDIKLATNDIEAELSCGPEGARRRTVNLDPGYVNAAQVVLPTTKAFAHRIYLGRGIYAEVTLNFKRSGIVAFEWTYPDYKSGRYDAFLLEVRRRAMSASATR